MLRRRRPAGAALTGGTLRQSLQLMGQGIRAERLVFGSAIAASSVHGLLVVGTSWLIGHVTSTVVVPALSDDPDSAGSLVGAGVLLAVVGLATGVFVAARRVLAGIGVFNLQARHRRAVTSQYLRLPLTWHRAHPAGQLLSNANADVEAATGVFNPLPYALGVLVMIGVAAVGLLLTDVWLAAAAMAIVPAVAVVNAFYQRRMSAAVARAQQLRAEVSDVAHESFEAALVVRTLGTAQQERERFDAPTQDLRRANVRVGRLRGVFDPVMDLLPGLGTLLVLGVGAMRVRSGAIDVGAVVAAAYLLSVMAVPVRSFGWVLGEMPRSLVGYARIARVLDARGETVPTAAPGPAADPGQPGRDADGGPADPAGTRPRGAARVEVRGIGLDVPVPGRAEPAVLLDDVDALLEPGTVTALVGPTGAGKTTLATVVTGLVPPTRGTVLVDGVDVRALPGRTDEVALVTQSAFAFADTVRANVALIDEDDDEAGLDPDLDGRVWAALEQARVADVIRALPAGLDAVIGEGGANLSGGQRQRLALARALLRRPRLLVLDDATSAVDPEVEQSILEGLRGSPRQAGPTPTVLLIAYRLSSILLADTVVHLRDGKVVGAGPHAELLASDPGYRELVSAYEQESARRTEEAQR